MTPQQQNDLLVRFIYTLPKSEKQGLFRLFYHLELAYYFYLDFMSKPNEPIDFIDFVMDLKILNPCFHKAYLKQEYKNYLINYKWKIPVAGAIVFCSDQNKILMTRAPQTLKFGFPKGKINLGESLEEAAIRETFEETGYKIKNKFLKRIRVGNSTYFYFVDHNFNTNLFVPKPQCQYEIEEAKFVSLNECRALLLTNEASKLVKAAGLFVQNKHN